MNYSKYLAGTRLILAESQKETRPYRFKIGLHRFICRPNVFSPKYFQDTRIFAENLPVHAGEEFLEIGGGTGVVSIFAALKGARRVVVTDVSPDAVQNCLINVRVHGLASRVEVRFGELFSPLRPGERFDTIFWNTPHGFVCSEPASVLEKAVFDFHYRNTRRFIREAMAWLKPNGKILIGFSSTLGRLDLLRRFCREAKLNLELLYAEKAEEIHPVKFEIFAARPK